MTVPPLPLSNQMTEPAIHPRVRRQHSPQGPRRCRDRASPVSAHLIKQGKRSRFINVECWRSAGRDHMGVHVIMFFRRKPISIYHVDNKDPYISIQKASIMIFLGYLYTNKKSWKISINFLGENKSGFKGWDRCQEIYHGSRHSSFV